MLIQEGLSEGFLWIKFYSLLFLCLAAAIYLNVTINWWSSNNSKIVTKFELRIMHLIRAKIIFKTHDFIKWFLDFTTFYVIISRWTKIQQLEALQEKQLRGFRWL